MDKKILSAAIIAAMAAPVVAVADTTLYGQIDLSMDSVDMDNPGAGVNGDDINMNSNNSRIGVKGSEDLGNGLKAIFQLEYQVDPSGTDSSATAFTTGRDQWIGLAGDFGKLRFGTMSTMYKSTGSLVDPLWDTALQSRSVGLASDLHNGAGANGEGRATKTVAYDTPDFNGLSAGLTYSFDDECTVGTLSAGCPDDDSYSVGAKYENGPAVAFVDYVTSDQGGADDAWKVGGSYSFGDVALYGQYEADGGLIANGVPGDPTAAENEGADVWQLGGSFTMGNAMLYAGYGQGDDDDAAGNTEYDAWTIAGKYNFSKRTMTYVGFNQQSFDAPGAGEVDQFSLGLRHKF